jgi:hypothetical protein
MRPEVSFPLVDFPAPRRADYRYILVKGGTVWSGDSAVERDAAKVHRYVGV